MKPRTRVTGSAAAIIISIVLLAALFIPTFGIAQSAGYLSIKNGEIYAAFTSAEAYDLAFSTYFGGTGFETGRDVYVDEYGNIYVTGGTTSTDFTTTTGPAYNNGACSTLGANGRMDVFVAKFDPNGNLIWSRLLGGPCYDRTYAIELDSQGYVLVSGRAGEGFPVTPGAFQTTFQGIDAGPYGWQNGFVAKISPDGSAVEWASYVGVASLVRDIAVDVQDNIYLTHGYQGQGATPPAEWFTNAFQPDVQGGPDSGAMKVNSSGTQVLWATWLGGSNMDSEGASIRVDDNYNVYLGLSTSSTDIPTTVGAYDDTFNGGVDFYAARLSPDGSNLLYGTYLGGSGEEWVETHNIALDGSGNLYAAFFTDSTNFPTTPGAIQSNFGGGRGDMAIAKFSPTGALLASTYLGGSGFDEPEGTYTDADGDFYFSGRTDSSNFPVSANAYQPNKSGDNDAVLVELSTNFSQFNFATFLGGPSFDYGRNIALGSDGSVVISGVSNGSGWPTQNPYQANFGGGNGDAILAKFSISGIQPTPPPNPTPTSDPKLTERTYLPLTINRKSPLSTHLLSDGKNIVDKNCIKR